MKRMDSREDVNLTWYNLDRSTTSRKMDGVGNISRLVDNLSKAGMDYYRVSESGQFFLHSIKEEDQSDLP